MRYCKSLNLCFLFFSFLLIQGCSILQKTSFFQRNDLPSRKLNNSLPIVPYVRTISDVSSVGFEWKTPANLNDVEGYAITYRDEKQQEKTLAIIKNPYATHHYVADLDPQRSYTFYLVVLGKNQTIATQSKPVEVKTSYIDPLENVFASKSLPQEVKIFWSPHSNPSIRRYIVQREDAEGKFINVGVVPHRLFVEFFDTGLEDAKAYNYRVISENFDGVQSLPSKVVSGFTRRKPNGLENLKATSDLSNAILLSWSIPKNAPFPITSFRIYAANKLEDKFKKIGETQKNFFKESDLKDNQVRYYKVVPVDRDGIEGDLSIGAIKGSTLPPPPTPTIATTKIKNNAAIISWSIDDPTKRVASYRVCRPEKGDKKTQLCFEDIQKRYFIDRDMKPKITYHYEVFSIDKYKSASHPSAVIKLGL